MNGATRNQIQPLRILAVADTWHGSNSDAFVRAFHRAGHSVAVVSDEAFFPVGWHHPALKVISRILQPLLAWEYQKAPLAEAPRLQPEIFFVFKGARVSAETIDGIRSLGVVAVNFYPDIGFTEHGPYIPRALPRYDWVFNTKSFRRPYLESHFGIRSTSFLPHAYDPETHRPVALDDKDIARYGCQASFVGTWSPKKEAFLTRLHERLPDLSLKIWGNYWNMASPKLAKVIAGSAVTGTEYAKAIRASAISIALLVEARSDSLNGDLSTARTFEIPAIGSFMLHERTDEVKQFFEDGRECAMFGDGDELADQILRYLENPDERLRI